MSTGPVWPWPTTTLPVTVEYGPMAMSASLSKLPNVGLVASKDAKLNEATAAASIVSRKNRSWPDRFSTYNGYARGMFDARNVSGAAAKSCPGA